MENSKYYIASCFQTLSGRFLSLEEHEKSKVLIKAESEEDAFDKLGELQVEDSELRVDERWSLFPSNEEIYKNSTLRKL